MEGSGLVSEILRRVGELERRTGDASLFLPREIFAARSEVADARHEVLKENIARVERHLVALDGRIQDLEAARGTGSAADIRARWQFWGVVLVALLSLIGTVTVAFLR